jgi:hypothetical protein
MGGGADPNPRRKGADKLPTSPAKLVLNEVHSRRLPAGRRHRRVRFTQRTPLTGVTPPTPPKAVSPVDKVARVRFEISWDRRSLRGPDGGV